MRTWSLRAFVVVALIALAWMGLERLVHGKIRKQIEKQASNFGARVAGSEMTTSLWNGTVMISGLRLDTAANYSSAPFSITGSLDTLSIHDIHWFSILTSGRCTIGAVEIKGHALHLTKNEQAIVEPEGTKRSKSLIKLRSLMVEELSIDLKDATYIDATKNKVQRTARHIVISTSGLRVPLIKTGDERAGWTDLTVAVNGVQQLSADGYLIDMAHLNFSGRDSTLLLDGIRFEPSEELAAYGSKVKRERDAFAGDLDTLRFTHFNTTDVDLDRIALGGSLLISSGSVTVLRDKRRPDPPFVVKPLLAKLIMELADGQGLDTIRISDLDITYMERAEKGTNFARIPITSLRALITGMRSVPDGEVQIRAGAKLFGNTPVELSIDAPALDSTERFTMRANIGKLAFRALDPALRPLTGLSAQDGHLDTLILSMTANSRTGNGSITMAYRDLRVRSVDKDMKGSAVTAALGILRRSHREVDGRVETVPFDVVRRRDRAIFNYLWSGLREGVKNTVMPGLLNATPKK